MTPTRRRSTLALGVVVGLAGLAVVWIISGWAPPAPLPNPNGYDDFLAAGKLATGRIADQPLFDHERLREVVATNAEALRLVRLGLSRQCSVPTASALTNVSSWTHELSMLKRLGGLLADQGRLHELEGRPGKAALVYAEAIRYGNETSRGGFLVHRIVGLASERNGCWLLENVVPKLGGTDARPVIAELQRVDKARVPWDEIRRNERKLPTGTWSSVLHPVRWLKNQRQAREQHRVVELRIRGVVAQQRLLLTELALRACLSERGQAPSDLGALVPDYLSAVPEDPFSRRPLVFRPQGANWLLYRVGPDGVDDGGKEAVSSLEGKGDILFNTRN